MTKKDQSHRNGSESSGAETVRGGFAASQRTPSQLKIGKSDQFKKNANTSASNPDPYSTMLYSSSSPDISPTEQKSTGFGNHRKALAVLGAGGSDPKVPQISRDPPTAISSGNPIAPWDTPAPGMGSSSFSNSFYNDSPDYIRQMSPSFPSGTGKTMASDSPDVPFGADEARRPSVASATTVSSVGSKTSISGRGFHKSLKNIFGEDYSGPDSKQGSDASLPTRVGSVGSRDTSKHRERERNNSVNTTGTAERAGSPTSSRPRTPLPPSDVTPWMYQSFQDIPQYGDAPVRQAPQGPDGGRFASNNPSSTNAKENHHHHHHHHNPFHLHRHTKSKEETPKSQLLTSSTFPTRPTTSRELSSNSLALSKVPSTGAGSTMAGVGGMRATSPTPSGRSGVVDRKTQDHQWSPGGEHHSKRSIFDKIRKKGPHRDVLKSLPGSTKSLQDTPVKAPKPMATEPSSAKRDREASIATFDSGSTIRPSESRAPAQKDLNAGKGSRFGRRGTRGAIYEREGVEKGRLGSDSNQNIFSLDTNMDDMEGIIAPPPLSPGDGGIFVGPPIKEEPQKEREESAAELPQGAWDAPDSWAVKKAGDDLVGRLPEIDENGDSGGEEDDGTPYCVRVFRVDSTFATLSTGVNTTVADILQMLGRKSFLQDELNNYQIVMRKHDLSRQLEPGERPIHIQKRLLEQVGYQANDHIEEIGREDNSYLCRFTFLPNKLSGFYSLDTDPGFNKMQKFSHVDLQGRSLVTIPIILYKKASEIISLNLSRNLALDVPKDFVQGCVNLREIRYIGNEAWRLPASLSLATRLTVLDISNNRIEQLKHAELDKLINLVSLKLSNNRLTSLPAYFGAFKSLRSLNMSSNDFKEFPAFLCDLPSLVDLDMSFNQISSLPNIGKLQTLERLWITNNNLTGPFNETFKNLVNLKEIDARFNGITSIDNVSQLPRLEQLLVGHNSVSLFKGTFPKLRTLVLDHCPMTQFDLESAVPTLTALNIASAKLVQLKDSIFENMPNLTKLLLDKNHFINISSHIGKLSKLEHFSIAKNPLSQLPASIGCLTDLKYLNVKECNLKTLPPEIWYCLHLESLNVSSNVMDSFPKQSAAPPMAIKDTQINGTPASTPALTHSPSFEELGPLEAFGARRPSQASGGLTSMGTSPAGSTRKGSIVSVYGQGRKASVVSRSTGDGALTTISRKDSNLSQRVTTTFAGSLKYLYLADNHLEDDVFRELSMLPELRLLNLSYNELTDLPQGLLRRWANLTELYLSGNELTSLPSDDLEESSNLKVLHLNGNRFQVLPAELCKVHKLALLDVGSNSLKYNVSNWPYDWNWNWNRNLKYLNFSGNRRLEIKPSSSSSSSVGGAANADLTNFNSLTHLRILGLMDVTLTIPTIPDQTEDRRVRTTGSLADSIPYGMADSLGRNEHLSIIDLVVPRFRSNELETLVGMFDGQTMSNGGSKVAKFLHENFIYIFTEELSKLQRDRETPLDALRRTFLTLNKDMAAAATQTMDQRDHQQRAHRVARAGSTAAQVLSHDDLNSGGVATVLYLQNLDLFVANVGDAQAILIQSNAQSKPLTMKHDPAEPRERERIRMAGGYVSRHGKLNDVLDISRAFGYYQMMPSIIAAPYTLQVTLTESDEMVLLASREFWDYVTPDLAVDVAREQKADLMLASQKLRDLAIAFGATNKIMVMLFNVSDLRKRDRSRFRGTSLSMAPTLTSDDQIFPSKRGKRGRDGPGDSRLARLEEVTAPEGELAIVFTDIKNSTQLWETNPVPMRSAIQIHNELFRRQLRLIGGYEVKTEGDAFMVSFPTATSALLWCFSCQSHLLELPWPTEILETIHCQEKYDSDQNVIFRGLSVRMGIHWGKPVSEMDPITRRMDYFGPMVNRASRVSSVADGGQIFVSSDFISEVQRVLEAYADTDRTGSTGSDDTLSDDAFGNAIRRELRQLSSQGFEVKDLGEKKLKGLENPEFLYLMYPHSLAGRLAIQPDKKDENDDPGTLGKDSELNINPESVWSLWDLALRLEMLCSLFENPERAKNLKKPELSLLNRMKNQGGEITDAFMMNLLEHQVTRIETCANTLQMRHIVNPFKQGDSLAEHSLPMGEVMSEIHKVFTEFRDFKRRNADYESMASELQALKQHMSLLQDGDV